VTDRAAAFLGVVMTSFGELFDITKIPSTSYLPCSNLKVERLQKILIDCLKGTCTERRPYGTGLTFDEMALRSGPIVGVGLSAFKIVSSGYNMNLPIDVAKSTAFDEGNQTPHDTIKEILTNLDLINKIIKEHILENQTDMKLAFDEKVTPYSDLVGSLILFIDPVENVGMSGKLHRH